MKSRRNLRAGFLHNDVLDDLTREENDTSLLNHQRFGELLIDPDENAGFKYVRDTHGIFARRRRLRAEIDDLDDDLLDDSLLEDDLLADDLLDQDPMEVLSDTDVLPDKIEDQKKIDTEKALEKTEVEENNHTDVQREGEPVDAAKKKVKAEEESDDKSEDKEEKSEDEKSDDKKEDKEEDKKEVDSKKKVKADEESDDKSEDKEEKSEDKKKDKEEDKKEVDSAKKVKAEDEELTLQNNQSDSKIEVQSSTEFPIVDVDCMDDADCDDMVFASINGTKHVIKSNRIIASMTADTAELNQVADVYLDDDFDEAVVSECTLKGLRAGLRSMGFTLATVKIKQNAHVSASVAKATAEVKASLAKEQADHDKVMQQSLAIASVGLNRNMFKDQQNTLRQELTAQFEALGIRNASRIVKAAFADYGVDYAKKLLVIANDVAKMPEQTRDSLAASLDMTNEPDDEMLADPTLYGDPVTGEDDAVTCSVEAALSNPIKALAEHKVKASVNKPLPFAIY